MKTKAFLTAVVLVVASFFVLTGNKSELKGKIQDYSGVGILFSTLEVYKVGGIEGQLVYKAITNINGEFELPDLVPGDYKLVIKAEGFEDKIQFVQLGKNDKNIGSIQLDGNVITLNPLLIYGEKA